MGLGSMPVEEWLPLALTTDHPGIPLEEAPPLANTGGQLTPPGERLPDEALDVPVDPLEETPGIISDGVDYPPREGEPSIGLIDDPEPGEESPEFAETPEEAVSEDEVDDGETETIVYLEEAEERPPVGNGSAEFAAAPDSSVTPTFAFLDLPVGTESHFVQVAAFRDEGVADQLATRIGRVYPVRTVAASTGTAFRVLIGPLGPDESGALLLQFRRSGFPDAFIRKNL
jgi:hypothetical protein